MGMLAEDRHMRISDVAAALGLPQSTVSDIERRAIRKCRAYLAARGIELADLFDDYLQKPAEEQEKR